MSPSRLPQRSLRVRFVVAIGALVAIVLVANGLVQAVSSRRFLREDIERRARAHAALAVGPVCTTFETYYASGYSKFRELMLESIRLNPDLERLEIYDTGGRALFDSRELRSDVLDPARRLPPPAAEPAMLRAVRGMEVVAWSASDATGRPLYVVVAPYVEEWGRHRYSVAFYVNYESLRAASRAAAWRIFFLSVGSLALGLLIAIALSSQSLGPLEALTRGARDLAAGRLDRRIDLRTGDEFEVLAGSFNQMAEHLQKTVSDLEESNRTLGEMNRELQALDRMKSDLLANVSHELRTPLTAIQGYTEAMDEGLLGPVNEPLREALAVVRRNTRRLMGMIEQLLSFSRFEAGAGRMEMSAFDLRELVQHAVGSLQAARGDKLNLAVAADEDLPPVWGDPTRIAQVVENLLTNAAKFTAAGDPIRISVRRQGGEVEVAVSDRGIGIQAQDLPRIFDRFYQADSSSTRRYGGLGLGLAIVREILTAHGRQIAVESEPGRGTTFRFTLPLAQAVTVAPAGGGRRILVVDDDLGFVDMIGGFLQREGFTVEVAATAQEGFDRILRVQPDLVLLDRLLPDADGFDLLSRLKEDARTRGIPVLVVSIRKEKALGLRLGASGYLTKPVDPGRVRAAIDEILGGHASMSPSVLVVEDQEPTRRLIVQRLQAAGMRTCEAADGEGALRAIATEKPALVLLDLGLPGVDGWEVLRRLRHDPDTAELPVIVLTGSDLPSARAAGRDLGIVDVVGKPFDLGSLLEEIEQAVGVPPGPQGGVA